MKTLRSQGRLHPELALPAREGFTYGAPERENDPALGPAIALPKLFSAYMRLGAQVISEPALDRAFSTVDFLVLLDTNRVPMSRMGHGKQ